MKPRKPDPLPKIRIQIGAEDLRKVSGGSRRTPAAPPGTTGDKHAPDGKAPARPAGDN